MKVWKNLRVLSDTVFSLRSYNRYLLRDEIPVCNYCKDAGPLNQETTPLFFNENVQELLKKLTRIDYEKVFRSRKLERRLGTPKFKFMTDEELEKARKKAELRAEEKLQMPPILPPRKQVNHVYVVDKKIVGYTEAKYLFTDISFGKNDRNRHIVLRDVDGTLRKATWEERDKANQIYFPRPGRKLRIPKMFQPEYFEEVLSKGWYEFILDRACIQFEPDDPLYIHVTQATYDKIAETGNFKELESTRHYGPMIYHLTEKENLSSLFIYFLNSDRLVEVVDVIRLHGIIHPDKICSAEYIPGEEFLLVKAFISEYYHQKPDLMLTLKSYEDFISKPKSQAVV
ncbi:small ribosomal subunit protein mS22 [Halyomorpha halys]|uniref:small ribosomal subunit protein mS22 n=1 Tax=Halyomorpha halys TaxID=286706 RepID=UPI0006D522A0|nr:28S ribosomal protein S22, mitochondrial [Halyomorpha halys]